MFFLSLPTKNSSMFFMSTSIPKGVPKSLDKSPSSTQLHLHRAHHGGLSCFYAFQYLKFFSQLHSRLNVISNSSKSLITFFTLFLSPLSVNLMSFAYYEIIYQFFLPKVLFLGLHLPQGNVECDFTITFNISPMMRKRYGISRQPCLILLLISNVFVIFPFKLIATNVPPSSLIDSIASPWIKQ